MNFPEIMRKLLRRNDLTQDEAYAVMTELLGGHLTEGQTGGYLAALAGKGESVAEIAGSARAMRDAATRITSLRPNTLDTVGTGGDGGITFNISTTTSFVAAGAGATVAKHGNRAASGKSGAADCLEALGMKLDAAPELMEEALNELGVCFLFAPAYHQAMRHAVPVRKQLGVRTLFNMLGPLTNPAGAACQLLGVFSPELTEAFAQVLKALGSKHVLIVHGCDGMDEITLTGPTRCAELNNGLIRTYDIQPEMLMGYVCDPSELSGGDAAENAAITEGILTGKIQGPKRDIVVLNAGAALYAADVAPDIQTGIKMARESIDSGAAVEKLRKLIEISKS